MNRRKFLTSTGVAAVGTLVPSVARLASAAISLEPFQWQTNELIFAFDVKAGKLRQKRLIPMGDSTLTEDSSGVEVALQCSGENSPDQGMKLGMGQPEVLRKHIPLSVPFYPLGTSDITDCKGSLPLGMRSPEQTAGGVEN
jgi:hypothetical protein